MCTHCVMESVKRRMMSRRDLFRRAATGSVAAAAATSGIMAATPAARAQGAMRVEDMTHELFPEFPTYFGEQQFFVEEVFTWDEHMFNLNVNTINEHTGTHIDAPLHFSEDGQSVAEIPLSNLVVPLAIVGYPRESRSRCGCAGDPGRPARLDRGTRARFRRIVAWR